MKEKTTMMKKMVIKKRTITKASVSEEEYDV
jgi:hypothetical protein